MSQNDHQILTNGCYDSVSFVRHFYEIKKNNRNTSRDLAGAKVLVNTTTTLWLIIIEAMWILLMNKSTQCVCAYSPLTAYSSISDNELNGPITCDFWPPSSPKSAVRKPAAARF